MYTFIYKQLIEYTSGVLWTLSIVLSVLLNNILKAGSIFVLGRSGESDHDLQSLCERAGVSF